MKLSPKLRPCIWDALVAAAVIALAVGCAASVWPGTRTGGEPEAVVKMRTDDGDMEIRMELDGLHRVERTISSNGYNLKIVLTDTEVWVEESDCPTQDCVHTGAISRSGQSIVCLPARVIVQLESGTDDGALVDAVIG